MTFKPWDCAQPDEWLPRALRLCWGGDGGGEGGGFGGGTTGGGDWGSAGSFDASGFNAGGDLSAWAGTAYDASTFGTGAGAGGDWASFGPTNYAGFDAPNPSFDDIAGPNPGVTTGGGDWGSAGTFSAAGTGGGQGGAMFGATQGAADGFYSAGGGGGLFGDYGGGGGGFAGDTGGGGGGGGGKGGGGGGSFGSFGSGTLGASNAVSAVSGPAFADTAGSAGGHASSGGKSSSEAAPSNDDAAPSQSEAAPEAAPSDEAAAGTPAAPEASTGDEAAPSEAAPASETGKESGSDTVASSEAAPAAPEAAPAETEAAPSAFGPQTISDVAAAVYGPEGSSDAIAEAGQQAAQTTDYGQAANIVAADMAGEQPAGQDYAGALAGPDVVGNRAYEGPEARSWADVIADISPFAVPTKESPSLDVLADPNTWVAPAKPDVEAPSWSSLLSPSAWIKGADPNPIIDPSIFTKGYDVAPPTQAELTEGSGAASQIALDAQAAGEQGKAGQLQQDTFDSRFAVDPNTDTTNWSSVFEGAPTSPDWTSVFEGAASEAETAQPGIEAFIEGGKETDFANASPGAIEATIPGGRETDFAGSPAENAGQTAAAAAQQAGASPDASGAAAAAAYAAASRGASPAEQAEAAGVAAQQAGATAQQAMAIASGVYQGAQEGGGGPQAQGTTLSQVQDAVYGTGGPYITPEGNVYGGHTVADIQAAVYGDTPPGMPTGDPSAPLTDDTTAPSYAPTPGGAQAFIPGGQTTNFEYAGSPHGGPAPSLVDMAQPLGTPQPQAPPAAQPGLVDMQTAPGVPMPQARPVEAPQPGKQGGIGSDIVADPDDDPDTPEPQDTSQPPQDPTAPRPQANIPGQLIGANGQYTNSQLDNPRTNSNYRDSGRTDYPQGRPGIDFRTARQAGIEPHFRAGDINTADLDARLVERINRAMEDMPAGIRDTLTASSGYRPAHRGEAHEHGMDPRTSQESVYTRYNPNGRNVGPAARPGGSNHGHGRAIDFLSSPALTWLRANAGRYGLETLGRNFDIPHIQLAGARGNAGARPSAQEQQAQRALDAQNRQAAQERGGQGPTQQATAVPLPQGRPSDAPQAEPPAQPNWSTVFEGAAPAELPADISANLPRQQPEPPAPSPAVPRPPADIPAPAPFLAPPARGPADRAMLERTADFISKEAAKGLTNASGQADFTAAANQAATNLAKAGIPANVAHSVMLAGAMKGLHDPAKGNYKPTDWTYGAAVKAVNDTINAALRGYRPAAPGEVQGPYGFQPDAPAASGKRSEAPFGQQFLHLAAGGRDVGAPPAVDFDLPGQAGTPEWAAPQAGGMGANINPDAGPADPRSETIFAPGRDPIVLTPDVFELQQQEQQEYQQNLDPRGQQQASLLDMLSGALSYLNPISTAAARGAHPIEARAEGGPVRKGRPYVVGEEGPEVIVPDEPGTVVPHMPQARTQPSENIDRWPKIPAVGYPGRYGGVEREMLRQALAAQDLKPGLMDMIDSGRLRLNTNNWNRMLTDPDLIALGRSRIEDRR